MKGSVAQPEVGLRLADLIPSRRIQAFGDLPAVHFVADGSLGYGWQVGVPAAESVVDSERILAEAYGALLRLLPAGYCLDLYAIRDRQVEATIQEYAARPVAHPFARELAERTVARWRHAHEHGFFPDAPELNCFPRRQSVYVFLKSTREAALTRNSARSFLGWTLRGPQRTIADELDKVGQNFRRRVTQLEQTAATNSLRLRRMDARDYVLFVGNLVFPQHGAPNIGPLTETDTPGEAVSALGEVEYLDGERMITVHRDRRVYHKAVSMMWTPGDPKPGMLSELAAIESDIVVYLSFRALERTATLAKLKVQRHMVDKLALPFTQIESARKAQQIDELQEQLFDGDTPGLARLAVWVQGRDEGDVTDRAVRVIGRLEQHMPTDLENRIGPSILLEALPLARHPISDGASSRARRMVSSAASTLAPIGGYWEGTDPARSIAMYVSRWQTPFYFDPRVCDTNPHVAVVGGSGSGKTFWVQDFLMQLYCVPELYVFLISIKPDYERLARLLGRYIEITLDGDTALNGFAGAPTFDNLSAWLNLIVNMLTEGDAHALVTKDAQGLLSEKLMSASRKNWDHGRHQPIRETVLDDVCAQLNTTEMGRGLVQRLQPYQKGPYSRLFNRPSTLQVNDRFVFFNLSKVLGYKCAGPLSLVVFNYVNNIVYDPKYAHLLKGLVLDEGWALMPDAGTAALATNAFRAYRSLKGMAFAISQRLADYDTPMGQAILANTATKIVLRQSHDSLQTLPKYLALTQREMELIASLDIRRGLYSEAFYKLEGYPSTVARVIPDALRYAVATTDPDDTAIFNRLLVECNEDYLAVVRRFAAEYPFGGRRPA
jgi:TraG P-loop domain